MNWNNWNEKISYQQAGNNITIDGTNQFFDFLVSAQCWPKYGYHAGCLREALKIIEKVDFPEGIITIEGHSMGGAIAQVIGVLLAESGRDVEISVVGAYPVVLDDTHVKPGTAKIYGNDPAPSLFPWFKFAVEKRYIGPPRKWWKINFMDHVRY